MSETAQEPSAPTLAQKVAAEVLGTFVLVLFGVGTAVISQGDYVATGLSFGLAVLVMVYAVGRISGGHFNPAVSLGAAMGGRISWREAGIYMLAQLGGALVAGLVLFVLLHGFTGFDPTGHMGQNSFGDAGSGFAWWAAFLLELILTAVFVTVILAVTDIRNEHPSLAPLAIGLTLTAIHFASIGATGTSVNPARSIGPGVFAGSEAVQQLWLFILAPLVGAAIAGACYHLVFGRDDEPVPGSGLRLRRPQPAYTDAYQQQWNQQAYQHQQQWGQGAPQGYQQPYPPAGAQQPWDAQHQQAWESQQTWSGGQHARGQDPDGSASGGSQTWEGQTWEGKQWEGQQASWQPPQDPQSATQQPWTPQAFPPAPTEPYWSQQLPENWDDTGDTSGRDDDGEGHTQVRPPEDS
ncbi:MAG: MIP family channel protein [Nocardioides sp.]|uniref:MIP/aquaporin family protein n=1 Tax=Nocardioides sp. TaxID=35761 RepID=UPI0039E3B057